MDIWKPSEELARRMVAKPRFSLADLREETSQLGLDQLAYAMFAFIADKMTKGSALNEPMILYALSQQILRYYLGDDWVEANIFDSTPGTENWHKQGRAFLRSDSTKKEDNFRHQHRVMELAECLYNLQCVPGIDYRIALLQRENLLSAFAELQCARAMASPKLQLRFITPQGEKQSDYDSEIVTPKGRTVCCEIKAKDDETPLDQKSVIQTVEKARRQLPSDKPGIVWIVIPENWSKQRGAKAVVDSAIERKLRQAGRLVAVCVGFEIWEPQDAGWLMTYRFTAAVNSKSRFYQSDVDELFGEFGSHKLPGWCTLEQIVSSISPSIIQFISQKISEA